MVYGLWFMVMVYGFGFRVQGRGVRGVHQACIDLSGRSLSTSSQLENNHFTEMCCGTEAGSYLRLTDSCITQLKVQGPSRTCNESKEEEHVLGMGALRPDFPWSILIIIIINILSITLSCKP